MIRSFKSRALKRFWIDGKTKEIAAEWQPRVTMVLDRLDVSKRPTDMRLPGFGFHPLKGPRKGQYAVSVSGNFRITFAWLDEDAIDVHLEDYH
jgi:toxin HigB-1